MPTINVNDAYVLNETGAEVDKVTGLFTKNENASTGEKQMARLNIAAGGSNRNLLDNAYFVGGGSQLGDGVFPINQRGQSSYTGSGTCTIDRWIIESGMTLALESGGIRVTAVALYTGLTIDLPAYKLENGETYTISVKVDDDIHSATFVANNDGNWANVLYGTDWYTPYRYISGVWQFKVLNAMNVDAFNHLVQAVKLEKGSVSTLANDPPPDFGEELRKCQRYFTRLSSGVLYTVYGNAVAEDAGTALMMIPLPVPMRATPTSVVWNNIRLYDYVSAASISPSTVYAIRGGVSTPLLNVWCGVSPAMTAAHWLTIQATDASAYIEISAEL